MDRLDAGKRILALLDIQVKKAEQYTEVVRLPEAVRQAEKELETRKTLRKMFIQNWGIKEDILRG